MLLVIPARGNGQDESPDYDARAVQVEALLAGELDPSVSAEELLTIDFEDMTLVGPGAETFEASLALVETAAAFPEPETLPNVYGVPWRASSFSRASRARNSSPPMRLDERLTSPTSQPKRR